MTTAFVVVVLNVIAPLVVVLYVHKFRARLAERDGDVRARRQLAERDDDDVRAMLEVSAVSSSLAKRLLAVSTTDWEHSPEVKTPPDVFFKLFLRDLALEADESGKFACLVRYVDSGTLFSSHERVEIAALFTDPVARDAVRAKLHQKPE